VIYVGWGAVVLFGKGGGGVIVQGWWRRFCIATVLQLFGASSSRLWIDGFI